MISKIKYLFKLLRFLFQLSLTKIQKKNISLIIGAGNTNYKYWVSSDYPFVDITEQKTLKKFFKKNEVKNILAEHVFEHLTFDEGVKAIKNIKYILKKGGRIRMAVPDGYNPSKDYIDWIKPRGIGPGANDHKILYNCNSVKKIFDKDWKIDLLEYFDEKGNFINNFYKNDINNGYIKRSRYNDKRNSKTKIKYNSIILDATLIVK